MKKIGELQMSQVKKSSNERGELLKYFAEKIKKPIGFVAMRLTGFSVKDMYYIKSICDQEERRGEPWSKIFYGSIKPK